MLNRQIPPPFHTIQSLQILEPAHASYDNGLESFVFADPQLELIRLEFVFRNHFDTPETPLHNVILSSMLREGTRTRTAAEIAEQVDFYGAYLIPEYSLDHTSLTVYTMRKYVDNILPIVHDILTESIFPEKELETYIRNNKQSLAISLKKNDVVARRMFFTHVFGANRYGTVPTVEAYDSVCREDLLVLYHKQIQPRNCTLLLSGRIDAHVLQQVRSYFGENWANSESIDYLADAPTLASDPPRMIFERRADALQSAIRMGGITLNRTHPDFPALQFVNTLLGGFFGSRLMRNIREEKGYTYGIGSAVSSLQHCGLFTMSTEVGVDVTKATLVEIEQEFDRLRQSPPQQAEVDLVRNYLQGVLLGSLESIFSHVDKFKATYFSGMDLSYYTYYSDVVANMTADRVQDMAIAHLDDDQMWKVVVGKLD